MFLYLIFYVFSFFSYGLQSEIGAIDQNLQKNQKDSTVYDDEKLSQISRRFITFVLQNPSLLIGNPQDFVYNANKIKTPHEVWLEVITQVQEEVSAYKDFIENSQRLNHDYYFFSLSHLNYNNPLFKSLWAITYIIAWHIFELEQITQAKIGKQKTINEINQEFQMILTSIIYKRWSPQRQKLFEQIILELGIAGQFYQQGLKNRFFSKLAQSYYERERIKKHSSDMLKFSSQSPLKCYSVYNY